MVDHVLVETRRTADRLAGVVDDGIEPRTRPQQVPAEGLDAGGVAEVEAEHLEPVTPLGEVGFGRVPPCRITGETGRHHQFGTAAQQLDAGLVADLHPSAREQHHHAGHVGELVALGVVQCRAVGTQLVVEVMDLAVAGLADVAVLRLQRLQWECLVEVARRVAPTVGDVLVGPMGRTDIGCREHGPGTQRANAGAGERLVVALQPGESAAPLQQLRPATPDLRIGAEDVPGGSEELGLLRRVEFGEHLRRRRDLAQQR